MTDTHHCRLSLAANPWFWPRETVLEYYRAIADSAVDVVYLGEIVCAKRRELSPQDWLELAQQLSEAGKEVCLSTLTLLEAASELGAMRRLCRESRWLVEANDMGAVQQLHALGRRFIAGPSLNLYNPRSLARMRELGMQRWVMPVELGEAALLGCREAGALSGVETELFAWGRLPLAWSARCYTARAENRPKDDCQWLCLKDPDGRLLYTRENAPFLTINGIQTQSALTHSLASHVRSACAGGADILRLVPQSKGSLAVIEAFDRLRRQPNNAAAVELATQQAAVGVCDGYWTGQAGMEHSVHTTSAEAT